MQKTILITGSTDGIGFETAKMLVSMGHHVLLHGRNPDKLEAVKNQLSALTDNAKIETYVADLSSLANVEVLAKTVTNTQAGIDVLINNAGILKTADPRTNEGLDVRFVVNTIAPYLLTQLLLPVLSKNGRVINLSSAAQAPVNIKALEGSIQLDDMAAYAQSKLAITMWSRSMALSLKERGLAIISVNPGSLLGTKMVREGFDITGKDIGIGAEILCRAALSDEFAMSSGQYYDNDSGQFAPPHMDALDPKKSTEVLAAIERILAGKI